MTDRTAKEKAEEAFFLVKTAQAFLFEKPGLPDGGNTAEISDELLEGWALKALEVSPDGWLYAETAYGYRGYIFGKDLLAVSREELFAREEKGLHVITGRKTDVLSIPKVQGNILASLPRGSFVELLQDDPEWPKVKTADGTTGFVPHAFLQPRLDSDRRLWKDEQDMLWQEIPKERKDQESLRKKAVDHAISYLGTQYRWGGKSPDGIDCSGLVFMSWMLSGIQIYRDASIAEGFPVRETDRDRLEPGDLLFFKGHVAMYIGGSRYIHATGNAADHCVTINSLDPSMPDYRDDLDRGVIACGTLFANAKGSEDASEKAWAPLSEAVRNFPGKFSVLAENLETGRHFLSGEHTVHRAASIIKLFIMGCVFAEAEEGSLDLSEQVAVSGEKLSSSAGVLHYLTDVEYLTIRDLCELMIIVSDNTAANLLIRRLGMEKIQAWTEENGFADTKLGREMMDDAAAGEGRENYTSALDVRNFLYTLWKGELVSERADREMLQILSHQQFDDLIPFCFAEDLPEGSFCHKTGGLDGVVHDAGLILWNGDPLILIFMASDTDVPSASRLIQDQAYAAFRVLTGEK